QHFLNVESHAPDGVPLWRGLVTRWGDSVYIRGPEQQVGTRRARPSGTVSDGSQESVAPQSCVCRGAPLRRLTVARDGWRIGFGGCVAGAVKVV
ncbi:MAG: hypothetical protein KDA61_11780, partial [Planctomycetales bacterium]|nr:hypothetical protein [Planctomycetales bacterium]